MLAQVLRNGSPVLCWCGGKAELTLWETICCSSKSKYRIICYYMSRIYFGQCVKQN